MTEATIAELLLARAALLEGTVVTTVGARSEARLDAQLFAVIESGHAAFRLREAVALAALRTPDTRQRDEGAGWVDFEPPVLDAFASDRALAWLESAWRRADEESTRESNAPPGDRRGG